MQLRDLDPARFARLDALLDTLLDTPPDERAARATALCEGDEALHRELHELLAAMEDEDDHPLDAAVDPSIAIEAADDPLEGQRAGPYELVELLGVGGMGAVFRARRADGAYDREVAVKVVRRGTDSLALIDRFHREREILARLEHPGITRLVDAGLLEDGRPYLAMDLVQGRPLLEAARGMSIHDRVALVEQVCRAVSYAHDRLIIHRDIKPSNVMVTAEGEARLLDFGVAKLVDDDEHTQAADRMLTPRWAAPEQFDGQVDVRTDLYAIGLLLHVLLSGRDVVERDDDGSCKPPSLEAPASERSKIAGDLDAIVMQALRPDPEARYPSVRALGDDLERYRQGLPVQARPERWYRVRKTIQRNLGLLSLAALFVASLIGYSVTITQQSRAIAEERDRASAEAEHSRILADYLRSLLTSDHAQAVDGEELTAAELLVRSERRLERSSLPLEDQAELMLITAQAFHAIGHFEESLDLTQRVGANEALSDRARFEAIDFAARVEIVTLRTHRSQQLALLGLTYAVSSDGVLSPAVATALDTLATAHSKDDPRLARALYWTSVALFALDGGPFSPDVASPLVAAVTLDRSPAPLAVSWALLAIRFSNHGQSAVADALQKLGRASADPLRARELIESALEIERRVYGEHHPITLNTATDLALLLESVDPNRSIALLTEAADALATRLPPEHPRNLHALVNLGAVLRDAGRLAEAQTQLSNALNIAEAADSRMTAYTAYHLAQLYLRTENTDAARATYARGVRGCAKIDGYHLERFADAWLQLEDSAASRGRLIACYEERGLAVPEKLGKPSDSKDM